MLNGVKRRLATEFVSTRRCNFCAEKQLWNEKNWNRKKEMFGLANLELKSIIGSFGFGTRESFVCVCIRLLCLSKRLVRSETAPETARLSQVG